MENPARKKYNLRNDRAVSIVWLETLKLEGFVDVMIEYLIVSMIKVHPYFFIGF